MNKKHPLPSCNSRLILLLVVITIPLTGTGIDIYVPSLPAITHYFSATRQAAQASISLYLLGYGVGQLLLGTLSDMLGRRRILLPSCLIYMLACIASVLSPSMNWFLATRLVQGLAVAGPGVVAKAILSDTFSGQALRKASTYLTVAWAIGPIVAPAIGGYLQHYLNWHACFYFLITYSFIIFFSNLFFLPETRSPHHTLKIHLLKNTLFSILSHRVFLGCALLLTAGYSIMVAFNVMGPFIIQEHLHYSAVDFGHFALLLGVCWFAGNILNRFMLHFYNSQQSITFMLWIMLIIILVSLLVITHLPLNVSGVMIPTCLLLLCDGLIMPNGFALALSLFPKSGGLLNAMLGSAYIVGAASISFLARHLNVHSAMPLLWLDFALIIACFFAYYGFIRYHNNV